MTATEQHDAALAARYGHTPSTRRRSRLVYLIGGIFAAIVVVAWVVWAGLDQSGASIDAEDTGHTIIDSRTVNVGWQVSVAAGTPVSCALQVQNTSHAIVGWKIVKLPAQKLFTTSHQSVVRATEQPVTGLIYSCWLT